VDNRGFLGKSDLAPGLLLAAPSLRDPNFAKSVVLLGRHDEQGALGWVMNGRELAAVSELLGSSGLFSAGTVFPEGGPFQRSACIGGPVAPATGWLVYRRTKEALPGELRVGRDLAVSGEASAFVALLGGGGPHEFRVVLGCAGWAPGQLEAEIAEGAWLPASVEPELLFTIPADAVWDEAYRRSVGAAPAVFSNRRGKA
jgi:putative transcriptional regulator